MNQAPNPKPEPPPYASGYYPVYVPTEVESGSVSTARLKRFLRFLRRLWWLPVATTAVTVGAAVTYVLACPPTYISRARMWETERLRLPEGAAFTGDTANYYGTQIELLRSTKVQQLTLARLQSSHTNLIAIGDDHRPLQVKVKVAQAPKSSVFAIEASCSNPEYARAYLNALAVEYVEYKRNIRRLVSGDTLASISDQVLRMERELKTDQDALTAFEQTNNLTILQQEGTIAGGFLAKLKTQISELKLEQQLLEAAVLEQDWTEPGRTASGGFLTESLRNGTSAPPSGGTDRLSTLREIELLKVQRVRLSRYLRPKHPRIVKLDADLERAQELIDIYRSQTAEALTAAREVATMKLENIQSAIKEWEAKVVEANTRIAQADRLRLNLNRTQVIYDRLVALLQNIDIGRNIEQETLSILDPASRAVRSYQTETVVLGFSVVAGLALALVVVLIMAFHDDRLTSFAELSETVPNEVIGQVPEMRNRRRDRELPLIEPQDTRHIYAESYRNLRSALLSLRVNAQRPKVLLLTSAVPDEGTSTITANLARSLAFGGARVLVIDGDLRKGTLGKMMGLQAEPGLAEALTDPTFHNTIIQTNSIHNLGFVASGKLKRNPSDAFLTPGLDTLITGWRQSYDFILFDSSPIFAADDTTTLAPMMDGTLFVVRSRFSRARNMKLALNLLNQRHANVLGVVFNRADTSRASDYYYYQYDSYYSGSNGP